jgi:hypothetical protein
MHGFNRSDATAVVPERITKHRLVGKRLRTRVECKTPRSCSIIGLRALLLMGGKSVEVNQPWIVGMGRRLKLPTTMNPHQGLHAPGV